MQLRNAFFVVITAIAIVWFIGWHIQHALYSGDFCPLYNAAKYFIEQTPLYSQVPCGELHYYSYPPFTAILFSPFTLLSLQSANELWTGLNLVLYFAAGFLLLRELKVLSAFSLLVFVFASIFWPSLGIAIMANNIIFLIFFLLVVGYVLKSKKRNYAYGIVLGLVSFMKVWPAILLFHPILSKQKKIIVAGFGTLFAGTLLTLLIFSSQTYTDYFGPVYEYEKTWLKASGNISITGTMIKLFSPESGEPLLYSLPQTTVIQIAFWISMLLLLALFIFIYWYHKKTKGRDTDFMPEALLISASLLIFPLIWDWNLIILLLPLAVIVKIVRQQPKQPLLVYAFLGVGVVGMINFGRIIIDKKLFPLTFDSNNLFLTVAVICFITAQIILAIRVTKKNH